MNPKHPSRLQALLTPEFVEALAEFYPDKLPETAVSQADLAVLIGQQMVIRHLKRVLREIDRSDLSRPLLNGGRR